MNRRNFLKLLTSSVVAVAVATHIPLDYLPEELHGDALLKWITKSWNQMARGKSREEIKQFQGFASPRFFYTFESSLVCMQRFTSTKAPSWAPNLAFKTTRVNLDENLKGFQLEWRKV